MQRQDARKAARSDLVACGVALAAVLMFVATGSRVLPGALLALLHGNGTIDRLAISALFLNIALMIVAWRRYRDLRAEIRGRGAAEERALFLASRDPLTSLLNRGAMTEAGEMLIAQAQPGLESVALFIIGLDRFKNVNDVYGHDTGDGLLGAVAEATTATLPQGALCARLGGDEFATAFRFAAGDREAVSHIADQLVARLSRPFNVRGIEVHVSASIGIARIGGGCTDIDSLMRQADIAMSVAKNCGRNRAVWFDPTMESELRARGEVEDGLRRGIPLGEFVPYYQPQFDLATGQLQGFEVLARWNSPVRGLVEPDLFIGVAEECGLIGALSEAVVEQALREARDWQPPLTLSVNISPVQLKDAWLAQKLLKLLTETGFAAERLEVEITESSLFENLALAKTILTSLKNQGIRLALDDFGTGYSSLAHLRALPFDRIKIDRSFVHSMDKDPESWAIVKAVTGLGTSLGVAVTAEGIEDEAAVGRLREIGCDQGQGWYFGRPLTGLQARNLVAQHARGSDVAGAIVSFAAGKAAVRAKRSAGARK